MSIQISVYYDYIFLFVTQILICVYVFLFAEMTHFYIILDMKDLFFKTI